MTALAPGHAAARAVERFGLTLSVADMRQIMLDIIDTVGGVRQAAVLQCRMPNGTEYWFVAVRGTTLRVAYKPDAAFILTTPPLKDDRSLKSRVSRQIHKGRERRERVVAEDWS